MNTDPTIESINVPKLTAGTRYTFNITAVNSTGSSYILCGPILLSIGEPMQQEFTTIYCQVYTCNMHIVCALFLIVGIPLTPSIGNLFAGSVATEIKL